MTRAATTYNAASDYYDDPANSFWERFGRRTVARLDLSPGTRILDVCCGSGASAIPAAETVGSGGFVLGVDLAENLLELARRKAKQCGLRNLAFSAGDMLDPGLRESSFDAVIGVFGLKAGTRIQGFCPLLVGSGFGCGACKGAANTLIKIMEKSLATVLRSCGVPRGTTMRSPFAISTV